jgi:hypothetical protein
LGQISTEIAEQSTQNFAHKHFHPNCGCQGLRIMIFNHRLRRCAPGWGNDRPSGAGNWFATVDRAFGADDGCTTTHDEPQHPRNFLAIDAKNLTIMRRTPWAWQPGVASRHLPALKARSCMPHSSPAPTARRNSSPGRSAEGAPAPGGAGGEPAPEFKNHAA